MSPYPPLSRAHGSKRGRTKGTGALNHLVPIRGGAKPEAAGLMSPHHTCKWNMVNNVALVNYKKKGPYICISQLIEMCEFLRSTVWNNVLPVPS